MIDREVKRQKVLIVDDRKENLYALRKVLEGLDVEVVEAGSGNEALSAVLRHDFSLALLDVQMPEMDGFELAELLHQSEKTATLPIIFVSAICRENQHISKGYESGAVDFVVKPFEMELLLGKVKSHLGLGKRQSIQAQQQQLERTTHFLEDVMAGMPEPMFVCGLDGVIKLANQRCCQLLGYGFRECGAVGLEELLADPEVHAWMSSLREVEEESELGGLLLERETELRSRSGEMIPVRLSASGFRSQDNGAFGAIFVAHDLREARQREAALRLVQDALKATVNAVMITGVDGRIEWVNPAFAQLTGFTEEEAIGRRPNIIKSGKHSASFYEELWRELLAGRTWREEMINRRRDGQLYHVEQVITPVRDAAGEITHFVSIQQDITAQKEAEEQFRYLSRHDVLTGLPNRALMEEHLRDRIERLRHRGGRSFGLVFLGLDHFKKINEGLGHEAGNQLLCEVAQRWSNALQLGDIVARHGGDEFLILLDDVAAFEDVVRKLDALQDALKEPFEIKGKALSVSASMGAVWSSVDYETPEQMIHDADIAMHRAKDAGRGRYVLFDEEMFSAAPLRDRSRARSSP